MQVSVAGQLPEEVPMNPQGSKSLASHPVIGFVVQVEDAEKFFSLALGCCSVIVSIVGHSIVYDASRKSEGTVAETVRMTSS